ncbi:MAG: M15 family metallopeptidase [Desulfobulbaceae bacterium]|nr:M15 family metallopeptidase [Desulfobulbaceae bacterium]
MNLRIRHIRRYAIFFLIMLLPACATPPAGSSPPVPPPESLSQEIIPQEIQPHDEPQETLTLNGETYIIPPPWTGNRFIAPEPDYSDFSRIPLEYTHNSSKIYVLAAVQQPLDDLLQAAEKDGIFLKVESGYRSERYQKRIFKRMLANGRTFEDIVRFVAPPGYSQHMLGTAVDFFPSDWSFAETPAYIWLQENAHLFGFEETYSQYNMMKMPWESWHWNFSGEEDLYHADTALIPTLTKMKPETRAGTE